MTRRPSDPTPGTLRRWIAGKSRIPAAVAMLLAAWLARNQEEPR